MAQNLTNKKASIGEIREWEGKRYRKNVKYWEQISEENMSYDDYIKEDSEEKIKDLSKRKYHAWYAITHKNTKNQTGFSTDMKELLSKLSFKSIYDEWMSDFKADLDYYVANRLGTTEEGIDNITFKIESNQMDETISETISDICCETSKDKTMSDKKRMKLIKETIISLKNDIKEYSNSSTHKENIENLREDEEANKK